MQWGRSTSSRRRTRLRFRLRTCRRGRLRSWQAYPSWKLIELFNNEGTGDMLRTEALSVPGIDLPAHHRRTAVKDGPLTAVYATRRADRMNVFVMSRKLANYPTAGDDGYTPV